MPKLTIFKNPLVENKKMFSSSILTIISSIDNFITIIVNNLKKWWSDITLQTRLMAMTTLMVSLLMSSLTFWTLTNIQQ